MTILTINDWNFIQEELTLGSIEKILITAAGDPIKYSAILAYLWNRVEL